MGIMYLAAGREVFGVPTPVTREIGTVQLSQPPVLS